MTVIYRNNDHNLRKQLSEVLTAIEGDVSTLQANAGYALFVQSPEFDPMDSTTYFFGALPLPPSTTGAERRVHIPRAGTITRVDVTSYAKTAGSNEGWSLYVSVNNATQTLVATVSTSANLRYFQASGLSVSVAAGDYFEMKLVCPAWGTNPVGVYFAGSVFVT